MNDLLALALQVGAGVGLAACAGLRAFLPFLAVGVAARLEWITLGDRFSWIASDQALIVFGAAVVIEILADKIPVLDHLLDALQLGVKPVAGAVLALAVLRDLGPLPTMVLVLAAGGSAAGLVHIAKAKTRIVSTALTAGLLNPVISIAEDVVAVAGIALAIVLPLIALMMVAGAALAIVAVAVVVRTLRSTRSVAAPS